jgi:hypothetical protein
MSHPTVVGDMTQTTRHYNFEGVVAGRDVIAHHYCAYNIVVEF